MLDLIQTISILAIPAFLLSYVYELWDVFWENPQEILVNFTTALAKAALRDLILPGKKILVLVVNIGKDLVLKVKEIVSLVLYIGGQAIQSVENVLKLISTILSGFNHIFTTTNTIDRIIPLEYLWFLFFVSLLTILLSIAIHKVKKVFKND